MRSSNSDVSPSRTRLTISSSVIGGAGSARMHPDGALISNRVLRSRKVPTKSFRHLGSFPGLSFGRGEQMENLQLNQVWWSLRITYGLLAFLAGLDKFLNLLTDWDHYLSPVVTSIVPLSASTLMHLVGVVEMLVGIL